MWQILTVGFSLGLISSLHCIGMCGPLALSLPVQGLSASRRFVAIAGYHIGRIGTYAVLGLVSGLVGKRIYIAGWQHGLSILSGILILLTLIMGRVMRRTGTPFFLKAFYSRMQTWTLRWWRSASGWRFVGIGSVNGLLPCGMVYIAMAGALGLPNAWAGMSLMICFGAGTLPALLLLHFSRRMMAASWRMQLRRLAPFLVAGMATLLILRGLNLGIPYISPVLASEPGTPVSCH